MNKESYSWALSLVSVLLFFLSSCTYDYFEDETNYVVYVPKANKNLRTETYKIEELGISIYSGDRLDKERYSCHPFSENARSAMGNFHFRLYPGNYEVYCFTNTQKVNFYEQGVCSRVGFCLQQSADGTYQEPSVIHVERLTPTILFPGPVVTDTVRFERRYVGCICIAFKNLTQLNPELSDNNIKEIEIEASGIGVNQYLQVLSDSVSTRSSCLGKEDKMRLTSVPFPLEYKDFQTGIQNYYFPSPASSGNADDDYILLKLRFKGHNNEVLSVIEIPVVDREGRPVVLHMNETLVVEVNGNNTQVLSLGGPEQWNPLIEQEPGSGTGSNGTEI